MGVLMNAVSAVTLMILLMAIGYFMGFKGWMGKQEKVFLGKYIINIAAPCTCLVGLSENLSLSLLLEFDMLVLSTIVSILGVATISLLFGKILPLPHSRRGVFVAMSGFSNTLFVGYPVVTQIYGEESIPYLMIYYLTSAVFFQTIGASAIRASGSDVGEGMGLLKVLHNLSKQPPFYGIAAGLIVIIFQLELPPLVFKFTSYLGDTVSPLALIYCGYILFELSVKNLRPMPGHVPMLLIRLVLAPVICWIVATALGAPNMARQVFAVMGGLPVVSQVTVFAGAFGADEKYAAAGSCLSTILCCVSVPILVVLMSLV